MKTGIAGVFTPVAEVVCLTCHGEDMRYGRSGKVTGWATRMVERKPESGEGVTLCDKCRTAIVVRADVAAIRQFAWQADDTDVPGTGGAQMEQTGGMCCGCRIDFVGDDGEPTGAFAFVSDSHDGPGLVMGCYPDDDAFSEGDCHDMVEFTDHEVGLAILRKWAAAR
jgi:hypothetical protein